MAIPFSKLRNTARGTVMLEFNKKSSSQHASTEQSVFDPDFEEKKSVGITITSDSHTSKYSGETGDQQELPNFCMKTSQSQLSGSNELQTTKKVFRPSVGNRFTKLKRLSGVDSNEMTNSRERRLTNAQDPYVKSSML